MGDLLRDLGRGEEAQREYAKTLAISERLALAEPGRADYQRDLAASYQRLGDHLRVLGRGEEARQAVAKMLAIAEQLAQAEPSRADRQRDLMIALIKLAEVDRSRARTLLSRAFDIGRSLHNQGRLAPADVRIIDEVVRRLRGL
jgi:tetratricopeptide (TPR) repeat protein